MEQNQVIVKAKDLYQMLVAEMRYGLSRNNHLEPWGAIRHARYYSNQILTIDQELGLNTMEQLAEECINALWEYNYEPNNVTIIVNFIKDVCQQLEMTATKRPYNYQNFKKYLEEKYD